MVYNYEIGIEQLQWAEIVKDLDVLLDAGLYLMNTYNISCLNQCEGTDFLTETRQSFHTLVHYLYLTSLSFALELNIARLFGLHLQTNKMY